MATILNDMQNINTQKITNKNKVYGCVRVVQKIWGHSKYWSEHIQ